MIVHVCESVFHFGQESGLHIYFNIEAHFCHIQNILLHKNDYINYIKSRN